MEHLDRTDRQGVARRRLLASVGALAAGAIGLGLGRAQADTPRIDTRAGGALRRASRGVPFQLEPAPPLPPEPRRWDPGDFVRRVDVDGLHMAFSFDDGPSPYNTYPVLRALDEAGIKATFYLIGVNVRSFPQIARDIVSEGHELGNHSVYHSPYSADALAGQIGPNQGIIRSVTGVTPVTNRAPGLTRGSSILYACAVHGLYETHTHMDTSDWRSPRWSASSLINQFASLLSNGAIALYHDGGNPRPTPAAVPSMIRIAHSRGYRCHTVTELVNRGTPIPGNRSYASASVADVEEAASNVDLCNFDAARELLDYVERGDVKNYAERMRIVEALADLEAHQLEHR